MKFYFKCSIHGPISTQEVREDFVHLGCGQKVEQNNQAWDPRGDRWSAFVAVSTWVLLAATIFFILKKMGFLAWLGQG